MRASSLCAAARLSRHCASLRAGPRASAALAFPSRRPSRASSTAAAASSERADASPPDSPPSAKPRKGGKRDLAEAYRELRAILVDPDRLVRAVAGGKARGADPAWRRLEMRPVALKRGGVKLQVVKYDQRQAFTSNHAYPGASTRRSSATGARRGGRESASALEAADEALACGFANWRVETEEEVLQLRVTKSGEAAVHRGKQLLANASGAPGSAKRSVIAGHDRAKPRLLDPSDPFLVRVGVSAADGRSVRANRRDKYKQVEEFLKLLELAFDEARAGGHLPEPTRARPTRLADLGCGNAYLTFGAYAYLAAEREDGAESESSTKTRSRMKIPMEVLGVDVKAQARETNSRVAAELGWDRSCAFVEGTIADADVDALWPTPRDEEQSDEEGVGTKAASVDVVLALHACDTATDEALARAVRWRAPLTLVSPCCHHDLQVRMRRSPLDPHPPMTRHGILRERLGDVVTDAFRAHVMRLLGHRVDVTEWIGGEHTPRNTMIRAIRTGAEAGEELWAEYDDMRERWGVTPRLAEILKPELDDARARACGGGVGRGAEVMGQT